MSTIKADGIEAATGTNTDLTLAGKGTGVPDIAAGFKVGGTAGVPINNLRVGTDGELITWDASGDPAAVAVGTATHVLTSNGAGAAPTFQAAGGGKLLQVVSTQTGAVATGTTSIPDDDTIPQNTEGDEYMTLAITPAATANTLIIDVTGFFYAGGRIVVALFQDSTAAALAANMFTPVWADYILMSTVRHVMTAGTTSSTTFKVRAGKHTTGEITFNGMDTARKMGGVLASGIVIMEIEA